ncbi:MAG: FAD-dependent oxidoreductase [Burkholderiales bacterium]|jgi:3-(3-hydroxy-phenyl)propionate hydroxylase|nr:FAD-dependent oxidoreductase [Burkholderiales bacterium]
MLSTYVQPRYDYARSPDQSAQTPVHHPVVIVGAGPVGLAAAIDFAVQGVATVVLDEDNTVSVGSRAVCYAKRALEILDRLGCAEPVVERGISWNVGKVYFRDRLVYTFNLLPEPGHHRPAFVNLQQYHFEETLLARAQALGRTDVRWMNRVTGVAQRGERVHLDVETPDGSYALTCDWLVVADGARSPVRHLLGLESKGQVFRDRFLIADVVMKAEFPTERWFWFDPPFHRNQSALLHRQADDVWRIDFQLGWDADPEEEKKPERVMPRIKAMLGDDREFELEWVSVYTFQCRRMDRFRHGRVLFTGDAAHQVSPFGARGANSGIQDADNLVWKLKLVMEGKAPARLLDSYDDERAYAADENILNSTRSTDFITPKSKASRVFRDAALELAEHHAFARRVVNSGRLSVPAILRASTLNTADLPADDFAGPMVPGAPAADAPIRRAGKPAWLLDALGNGFDLMVFAPEAGFAPADVAAIAALAQERIPVRTIVVVPKGRALASLPPGCEAIEDVEGWVERRYDGRPGTCHLLRPDQHVTARWRTVDAARIRAAVARATCNDLAKD